MMVFIVGGRRMAMTSHTGWSINIAGRLLLIAAAGPVSVFSDRLFLPWIEFSQFAEICLVTTETELIGSNSGINVCY